jgi:hypothetical protein
MSSLLIGISAVVSLLFFASLALAMVQKVKTHAMMGHGPYELEHVS